MKPVAAMVATAVLMLAGLMGPFGGTGAAAAAAAPAVDRVPGVSLRLDLTDMTPRVVTATGPDTLTIVGNLVNTGDEPVEQLRARVQRSNPLTTEGGIRDALDGNAATDAVTPQFQPIADALAPGASIPVRLSVPLRGAPTDGLALSQTGVHEILVNVNAAPVGGQRARVAAVRMLLPVQSLPADATGGRVGSTVPAAAIPFSMLYPISDRPHRLSTVPGQRTLLADDSLATSFAAGGRLNGLVSAIAEQAPPNSPLRVATCLAIDPDLVDTAAAMRDGYDVRQPDDTVRPGTGSDAARRWLEQLGVIARGGCVIALPYADADLVALTRGGLGAAASQAITDGREALTEPGLLDIPSALPPVTWPADGAIDEPTLGAITKAGDRALVLSADAVEQGRTRQSNGLVGIAGTDRYALLTDPLLTAAARAPQPPVAGVGIGEAAATTSPTGTSSPLATQDTIGTLAFRVLSAGRGPTTSSPMVLAPPRQWSAEGNGARALLTTAERLMEQGGLVPRGLVDVLRTGPAAGADERALDYPTAAADREIPGSAVDAIREAGEGLADLVSAADEHEPGTVGVGPEEAFTPVRRELVRPASAALRGAPVDADAAARQGRDRIDELRDLVSVVEPPIPFSLGTSDAPLPLTVVNGLPVPIRVRVELSPTAGLQVAPIAEQRIPPLGRRQLSVNAKVTRSGQFTVDAWVITPGGQQLGTPSRLKVVSTAYGTITLWLTATAGALLVALVARRVIRRRRGDPDHPHGPDLPPDPPSDPPPGPSDRPPDPRRGPVPDRLPDLPQDPLAVPRPPAAAPTDPFPRPGPGAHPGPSRSPIPGR
ncbi:DUF6049 family protein [Pseudonocardia sp. CA-107938]|uniref:DUF6049 family protein n=1 Tax=Pseudonocardia sp. CA-107938 TaxID=3240021 RepID=UPI003D90EA08